MVMLEEPAVHSRVHKNLLQLIPRRRVPLENLTVAQLHKNFKRTNLLTDCTLRQQNSVRIFKVCQLHLFKTDCHTGWPHVFHCLQDFRENF
jgi:hypothetical protein